VGRTTGQTSPSVELHGDNQAVQMPQSERHVWAATRRRRKREKGSDSAKARRIEKITTRERKSKRGLQQETRGKNPINCSIIEDGKGIIDCVESFGRDLAQFQTGVSKKNEGKSRCPAVQGIMWTPKFDLGAARGCKPRAPSRESAKADVTQIKHTR